MEGDIFYHPKSKRFGIVTKEYGDGRLRIALDTNGNATIWFHQRGWNHVTHPLEKSNIRLGPNLRLVLAQYCAKVGDALIPSPFNPKGPNDYLP